MIFIKYQLARKMVNIQISSDTHINFISDGFINPLDMIKPIGEILVLAGDIGSIYKLDQLVDFIRSISLHFKHVLYVYGNQEFYTLRQCSEKKSFITLHCEFKERTKSIENFHLLDKGVFIYNDICFLGCTLWSNLELDELPRFFRIYGFNKKRYNMFHYNDLRWLETNLQKYKDYKKVVITHYPPFQDEKRDYLSSLYHNNLEYLLTSKEVDTWIFGHTHKNRDLISKNGTRLVSNQLGKPDEHSKTYKPDFVIKI